MLMAQAEGRRRKGVVRHRLGELGAQTGKNIGRTRFCAQLGTRGLLHGVDQHRQPKLPILAAAPYGGFSLFHRQIRLKNRFGPVWPKRNPIVCELPHIQLIAAPVRGGGWLRNPKPLSSMDDLRTDYLLIAMGIAAAVLALGYLLMT
jgi:hypothetical protein